MLPHAELDNYKLQVELLQEKLKRSEENRQKLEHKLENALHKKSEHEKIVRAKQRQKYEEFVNELEKRNERNRQLKQMLERIDQQTTALSARSERLRIMKMQYEMYFAKLIQSQTMRCIQGAASNIAATPMPIPILLSAAAPHTQQQQSSVIAATPIKNNENDPATSRATASSSAIYQCDANSNLIATNTVPLKPSSYTLSPSNHIHQVHEMASCNTIMPPSQAATLAASPLPPVLTTGTQHWTLAMATPTPTGMLLTTTPTLGVIPSTTTAVTAAAAPDYVSVPAYEYMQYPLGYLPRMRHLLQPKPNTPIHSDESDDLLQPMDGNRYCCTNKANKENDIDNPYTPLEYDAHIDKDIGVLNHMDLPTRQLDNDKGVGAPATTKTLRHNNENEQEREQQRQKPEQLLSNVSTTSSVSSVTLDKLPKTMTITEHTNAAAMTPIDVKNNEADDDGGKPQLATHFDETSKGISIIERADKGALPTLPTQRSNEEKSLPKGVTDDSAGKTPYAIISSDNGNTTTEADSRRKIDTTTDESMMANQQRKQHMTPSWQTTESVVTAAEATVDNKDNASNNAEMTGGFAKYAENKVTNNGLNSGIDMVPTIATQNNVTNANVSIEKIENEIYGELVNPPIGETDKVDARNAAQGLVKELVTQQQQQHQSENEDIFPDIKNNASGDYTHYEYTGNVQPVNTVDYEQSNSESYEPTYATIEGTTDAEVYQQPSVEPGAYTDDQNASDNYAPYAADPNAVQAQQDYSNLDYGNYDATQYAETGNYDPTAYPGYTYDPTTGQYTADPVQQYTNEDGTVAYDNQGGYEQQQYETPQETQDYDYGNYSTQDTADNSNAGYADTTQPAEQTDTQEQTSAPAKQETTAAPATPAAAINKPTSILSSSDKHAAANDAQKKKKRVNFVDSSETDESSSVMPKTGAGSESDFDFSSSEKSGV